MSFNKLSSDGWYSEECELWPGQKFSMKIKKVLHEEQSKYQYIQFFETESFGNAFVLDGIIQCTERDECGYQEMITFLPLNSHPNPKKILIVGGGDGGVAREAAKHPNVEEIHMVEIDDRVVDLSKQFLPNMAKGFNSTKLKLNIADGFKYIDEHSNEFDVIITDSSDPVGPGVNLFTESYFRRLSNALKQNGVICTQAENPFIDANLVKENLEKASKSFSNVAYAMSTVPTYPSGCIGFMLATNNKEINFERPSTVFSETQLDEMQMKYYDDKVHYAAFQLPRFVKQILFK